MPDIVITEFMDEAAVNDLSRAFDVLYDPGLVDRPDELSAVLPGARALIVRNRTQVRGDLLASGIRCVGRLGVGLDNIDVEGCEARGIHVYPATGANDASVAEYVIATAMLLLRGAYLSTAEVGSGEWPRQALIGREIGGRILGLIGYGSIARQTAARAKALGMQVIAHDPYAQEAEVELTDLYGLLGRADVISLHVPLTSDTRHLIDEEALAQVRKGSVLVNAARGGVVDEAALADALRTGRLAGAALDVFEDEPLPKGSVLADVPNLILTPHIAGVTQESNVRVSALIAERIRAHLVG